jgi:hypothetical protein
VIVAPSRIPSDGSGELRLCVFFRGAPTVRSSEANYGFCTGKNRIAIEAAPCLTGSSKVIHLAVHACVDKRFVALEIRFKGNVSARNGYHTKAQAARFGQNSRFRIQENAHHAAHAARRRAKRQHIGDVDAEKPCRKYFATVLPFVTSLRFKRSMPAERTNRSFRPVVRGTSLSVLALCAAALSAKADDGGAQDAGLAAHETALDAGSADAHEAPPARAAVTITTDAGTVVCHEQSAHPFLVRGNWFPQTTDAAKQKEARQQLDHAIAYRTEKYGYFEGFGQAKANPHPPKFYAKTTSFMGMSVQVHERIIPALKCVEAALKATSAGAEYAPKAMGGIRFRNTYRGVEVSNHVYGIAIDIEPDRNSCCGCVAPWPNHPLCKAKGKTVWERMAMPKSWVETFERFGFYWLGHDVLQDTMHFEFLGDPDKILSGSVARP